MLSFRHWRPRHLLFGWITYWIVLVAIKLGPAVAAALRVIGNEKGHGSVSASVSDLVVRLTITREATTIWEGSAHLLTIAMWVAGPPLVLWLLWIALRERERPMASVREASR